MRFNQSVSSDADQKSSTSSEVDGSNDHEQNCGPNSNSGHHRSFDEYDSSGTNECEDSNEFSFSSNRSTTNYKTGKGRMDSVRAYSDKSKVGEKRKQNGAEPKTKDRKKVRTENNAMKESSNHPLGICREILVALMEHESAQPFLQPVDAQGLGLHDYYEKVKEPIDLGTILSRLDGGQYSTAHEVRVEVTRVWANCVEYNGCEHDIYRQAQELAKLFDERFEAAITPPQHMGLRSFSHGKGWVGSEVVVYWDGDHKWFKARVTAYLGEVPPKGHLYRIKYPDDEETEELALPDVNVAILGLSAAHRPGLDVLPPWPGASHLPPARHAGHAPPKPPAAAAAAERPARERHAPPKLQVGVAEGRGRASVGGGDGGPECRKGGKAGDGGGGKSASADQAAGGGFIGDDGLPCTLVCHCRLLLWCRFKTRKGLAGVGGAAGAGGTCSRREWGGAGVRERRCSYGLCPQHTSNNRWHLVTPYTNAGGKDWSDLVGQTLCSCCFQQYRGKGTLIRARDVVQ